MLRPAIIALVLLSTACSQRSPWVVVPAPERTAGARASSAGAKAGSNTSTTPPDRPPSLSAVAAPAPDASLEEVGSLFFPVAGLDGARLADSFRQERDGGMRRHNAIDILAPRGTPVVAAQDGRILKLSSSEKGGISIYATDASNKFVFYYAHLDRYHDSMSDGRRVLRGDTLGYVGTTGNAPKDTPHLHFQLMRMPADGRYWNGEPLNPWPLLRRPDEPSWR